MEISQIKEWLIHVTYKPETILRVVDDSSRPVLWIRYVVVDATHQGRKIPLTVMKAIPPHIDSHEHFRTWLRHVFHEIEQHEADEFFQINGVAPYYPHA